MLRRLLLSFLLLGTLTCPASAAPDIGSVRIDSTPVRTWQELVKKSELIVVSWVDTASQSAATGRTVSGGKLFNYVQTVQVKQAVKGSAPRLIKLVSTGVEPLPDARSPLNLTYPGPLAEGSYVLFLHRVAGDGLYSTTGIWQGVYPLQQGKTIALEGTGFPELNQLTVEEITRRIKSVSP
ncbi:hypothetical protein ACFSO0_16575 [Brevibacillus sp. GCM10020057]|uniref:hypothetical protein n=1 Tax=Brevibacillus sp. GCM10020057 TaxID=3317327 RepID=UPI003632A8D6